MRTGIDHRVHVVTSGTGPRTVEVAVAAAQAGAGVVQVRAKDASTRELLALARAVAEAVVAAAPATRVVVDDRADVAYAARQTGAPVHGVHLGQDDLPVGAARALLGPDAVIGLTTGTLALVEASRDVASLIDYVGAGPFRHTPTKDSGRPALGLRGYPALVAASAVPVIAIGDVTAADVPALRGTGVAGVAMVRAVMHAEDPARVVRLALAESYGPGALPKSAVTNDTPES